MTFHNTFLMIIGFVILCFPAILSTIADKNKYIGFVNGIVEIICVQTAIAVVFQLFHLFVYPLILSINIVYVILRMYLTSQRIKEGASSLKMVFRNNAWMLLIVLAVSISCLYQVNYKYTGKINDIKLNRYIEVKDFNYPYPYFADEWYAVAFIKESIEGHNLPFKNPFYPYKSFTNLEFVFHSFLSEITLLLRLDPLVDYTKMAIGFNTLIILLIYLFLRYIDTSYLTAGISALTVLFITNGAVLPGIWTLIPLTLGLVSLLLSLFYFEQKNTKMIFLAIFLGLIFYPPLFVIFTLAFFFLSLRGHLQVSLRGAKRRSNLSVYLLMILASVCVISIAFLLTGTGSRESASLIISKLFYCPFEKAIPNFLIWNILPWPTIILALFALFNFDKERQWLKLMAITSLFYWFIYSIVQYRVVIEYERVVYVASIVLVILGGMGLHRLINQYQPLKYLQVLAFVFILVLSLNYTSREQWKKLTFYYYDLGKTFLPGAPANLYLTQDDLRIFKNIHLESFLSLPWKGTVIGIATNNYPRCTKSGTINININLFNDFTNSSCNEKQWIAENKHIKYFYVPPFNCSNFIDEDRSSEGLILYKYQLSTGQS